MRKKEKSETQKRRKLRNRYGITVERFDEMMTLQNGRCALCGGSFGERSLRASVDHNHQTKQVRALLHQACNVRLHPIEDTVFRAYAMAYLKKHGGSHD